MFKTIRKHTIALMLSGLFSITATAATNTTRGNIHSDLAFAFADSKLPMNKQSLSLLSGQDMAETEGQFLGYAFRLSRSYGGRNHGYWHPASRQQFRLVRWYPSRNPNYNPKYRPR